MKVSGTLEKTEQKLKKVNEQLSALRSFREEKLAEWKEQENKLLDEKNTLENIRVLQLVKSSELNFDELMHRLTPAGKIQVFSELKAPLPDEPENADESHDSDDFDENERIDNDEEDE